MSPRKLKIALTVSLIINLFVVGALIGGAAWLKSRPSTIAAGSLRVAGAELPRDERRAFRSALRDARRSMRPTVKDGRLARTQAAALLGKPVLDQAALDAALGRIRADDFAIRTAVERRAIAFAATLKPQDRVRLGEAMLRRSQRHPGRN